MRKQQNIYLSLGLIILAACSQPAFTEEKGEQPGISVQVQVKDTTDVLAAAAVQPAAETATPEATDDEQETQVYYLVVVAEGAAYESLLNTAEAVAKQLQVPVDQFGRIYEPGKGILVPYDDEDEMYQGVYYPRRFESSAVSLEMKYAFAEEAATTDSASMLVVAGMFEQPEQAKLQLNKIKGTYPKAKVVARELYVGCMH